MLSYLADSFSQITLIFNISMLSSNSYSRFSTMLSYYSGKLDSMWIIISTSLIITLNSRKLTLNNFSSVIQSSGSLVTSYNSLFANLLRSLVLDAPVIDLNFLFNLSHALKAPLLNNYLVTNC